LAGGDFAYKGIMAAYWILLARKLSTDQLGVIALANAIGMPAYAILDAGLTTHLIKDYSDARGLVPHHRERVRRRMKIALVLPIPLAGLGWILGGTPVAALATLLISFAYCSDFGGQVMLAPARALTRMEPDAVVRVIQSVGTVVFSVVLIVGGNTNPAWIAAASTLAYLLAMIPAVRIWRGSHGWADFTEDDQPDDPETKSITQGTIAMTAFGRLDSLLVQALLGSAALASYTVAFKLIEVARLLPGALSRIVLAHSSSQGPEEYSLRSHLRTAIMLGALGTVVLVLAGPLLIGILFGDQYVDLAGPTIRIIGFSTIPFAVMSAAAMYAVGSGNAKVLRRVMLEGLVVLIVAMAGLAELFGLEGAALGMLVGQSYVGIRFAGHVFGRDGWGNRIVEFPAPDE
jgi:O-antigen/teichoic acid export membrane protein